MAFKIEIFLLCFLLVGEGGGEGGFFVILFCEKLALMYMLPVEGESSSLVQFIDKILLVTLIKVFFSPHKVDFIHGKLSSNRTKRYYGREKEPRNPSSGIKEIRLSMSVNSKGDQRL